MFSHAINQIRAMVISRHELAFQQNTYISQWDLQINERICLRLGIDVYKQSAIIHKRQLVNATSISLKVDCE